VIKGTSVRRKKPQTPKGALKPDKLNLLIFLLEYKESDTTMFNRYSAAGNKKINMFISTVLDRNSVVRQQKKLLQKCVSPFIVLVPLVVPLFL
jgi:hypothetical protein